MLSPSTPHRRQLATHIALALLVGSPSPSMGARVEVNGTNVRYVAANPRMPRMTAANLYEHEDFWPFHVALTEATLLEGRDKPMDARIPGILIRVNDDGTLVVEWGSDGRAVVPIDQTDVVVRANRIRSGERYKSGPNVSFSIGNKIFKTASTRPLEYYTFQEAVLFRGYLMVMADPRAPEFEQIAASLTPFRGRHGIVTTLIPQAGRDPDLAIMERVRSVDGPEAVLRNRLSPSATRGYLGRFPSEPVLMLMSSDGRVLLERTWSAEAVSELASLYDEIANSRWGPNPRAASGHMAEARE